MTTERDIRPRYQVQKVPQRTLTEVTYTKVPYKLDNGDGTEKTVRRLEGKRSTRTVKDGFMVYFPRGHAFFVESESELSRLNLAGDAELVDMATGEVIRPVMDTSLMANTQRKVGDIFGNAVVG